MRFWLEVAEVAAELLLKLLVLVAEVDIQRPC